MTLPPGLTLENIRAEKARRSLSEYVRQAWGRIDPAPYRESWHIGAVCYHLQALTDGEINNLVINQPPGTAKSLLVSVMWPTFEWIDHPERRYIYSAYGSALSIRDTRRSRQLIQSQWYQQRYGDRFRLTDDQNQKSRYENDHGGFRLATSVGGGATGERAGTIVLDDPHKLEDAYSEAAMEAAIEHKNVVLGTRGIGEGTRKVVMMQRVSEMDVTQDILDKMENDAGEAWEMLVLPMRYEGTPGGAAQYDFANVLPKDRKDPRTVEGELLHPELYGERDVAELEVNLGDRAAAVLQQRPAPAGGLIFHREWWEGQNRYDPTEKRTKNRAIARFILIDSANKDAEHNAYTAAAVGELLPDYRLALREVVRERVTFDRLPDWITEVASRYVHDGKLHAVGIEDAASGTQALQVLGTSGPEWLQELLAPVKAAKHGKEESWRAASLWCRRDCVLLPEPSAVVPWLFEFEKEVFAIPNSRFKDQADAFAMLVNYAETHYQALSQGWRARLTAVGTEASGAIGA